MTEPKKPTRQPKKGIPDKATAAAYDAAWQAEIPAWPAHGRRGPGSTRRRAAPRARPRGSASRA